MPSSQSEAEKTTSANASEIIPQPTQKSLFDTQEATPPKVDSSEAPPSKINFTYTTGEAKGIAELRKDLKSEGANPYTLPTFFLWKELERLGVELESSGRISFLNYGSELENKKLVEFLQSKGYDAMTHTMHMRGYDSEVLSVFDSNQIKHIENRGIESESGRKYFNESSPNIFHSNPHAGAGLLGGSVAGIETDENGNITFNPEKFALGLLGGAAGSKAVAQGFKILKQNPQLKEKLVKELADTLAQGFEKAREKYPTLSVLEPRRIIGNEKGRIAQARSMLSQAEQEALKAEQEALEKV